jgi:hypothetical protein
MSSQFRGVAVTVRGADLFLLADPQQTEDFRPAQSWVEVAEARREVEMQMESWRLTEFRNVRLRGSKLFRESPCQPYLPTAEAGRFGVGQVGDLHHVSARHQYEPTQQAAAGGMYDPPMLIAGDQLPRWQPVEFGFLVAGLATGRHERVTRIRHGTGLSSVTASRSPVSVISTG